MFCSETAYERKKGEIFTIMVVVCTHSANKLCSNVNVNSA